LVQRPVPWNYYQNAVTSSCEFLHWLNFLLNIQSDSYVINSVGFSILRCGLINVI
jgi:hypothetical protein